jgi:hypothetical protein
MSRYLSGVAVLAAMAAAPTIACAQDDDWEFQQDPSRRISVASVRYDAGQTIIVQCREGGLTAVMTGLPPSGERLNLAATRADGRSGSQSWTPAGAAGAYQSATPGQDVRFMRGGGIYAVRTGQGAATAFRGSFDLPTQSANLDRVLTDCGWAITDERDGLASADGLISLIDPEAQPRRPRGPSRSVSQRRRLATPETPVGEPVPPPAEHQVSCIVRDRHLRDCRADHPASAQTRDVLTSVRLHEGKEVYPIEGRDFTLAEGRVMRVTGSYVIVVDNVVVGPAR